MALMKNEEPKYKGESTLWNALKNNLPDEDIVYNNRMIEGDEYDFCLFIPHQAIYVIEVKGWLADKIEVLSSDQVRMLDPYDDDPEGIVGSPYKQARRYFFKLHSKVKARYQADPLFVPMTCYPFIGKEEYEKAHLDLVSGGEEFTLLKEDLSSADNLKAKLDLAYWKKSVPHDDLSDELIAQIRENNEPDYVFGKDYKGRMYSVLTVFPAAVSDIDADTIIDEYARGIKRYIFVNDTEDLRRIVDKLDEFFHKNNIRKAGSDLESGYQGPFEVRGDDFRTFNMEIYVVSGLSTLAPTRVDIIEGETQGEQNELLSLLAKKTSFNLNQYLVEHAPVDKHIMVTAGAGTGKTYSMVSRVAFLCNKRKDPILDLADELVMMTFTNDAADNMKVRLKKMFLNYYILTMDVRYLNFAENVERTSISTIHKFALQILRNNSYQTGLGIDFNITSDENERQIIYDKRINDYIEEKCEVNEHFLEGVPVPVYELRRRIMQFADRLLTKGIDLREVPESALGTPTQGVFPYFNEIITQVIFPAEIEYLDRIRGRNSIELKECIIDLQRLLRDHADELDAMKYRYMFIDEFQDSDDAQIEIFQKILSSLPKCRLFIVGDLKQSIYRFRGATLSAFEKISSYNSAEWAKYSLNINYRTESRLLKNFDPIFRSIGEKGYLPYGPADTLVSHVDTGIPEGAEYQIFDFHSGKGSGNNPASDPWVNHILEVLEKAAEDTRKLSESRVLTQKEMTIAILVRSNWQAENIVTGAKSRGITIETKEGGDLFKIEPAMDLYKLVLAMENSRNPLYLTNLIKSNYTDMKLDFSRLHGLDENDRLDVLTSALNEFFLLRMNCSWNQIVTEAYTQPVLYVLRKVFEALAPWKNYAFNDEIKQQWYIANYEYLMEHIVNFCTADMATLYQVSKYLQINILTQQEEKSRDLAEEQKKGIRYICTTVHKSKGLEYGTVILPYTDGEVGEIRTDRLDVNYFDSKLAYTISFQANQGIVTEKNNYYDEARETKEQIADEARILYVAMTRAIHSFIWIRNVDSKSRVSWETLLEG